MPLALPTFTVAVLGLIVIFVAPIWRWSRGWGWAPFGMVAMGLATIIVFSLTVAPE